MLELLFAQADGVSAIPGVAESGGGHVGAVSHLIGATLQTAGLFAQSEILVNFRSLLELSGAMLYTVALIGAFASIALFGNYKSAIYLLLGPALFYFMLGTTVEGRATLLRTGERIVGDSAEDQRRLLAMMGDVGEDEPNPQLSLVFCPF